MWYNCGTTFATTHTLPCGPYCLRCLRCFRLRALACNLFSIPVQAIANRCTCSLLNSFRFYTLCLSPFGCGGTVARVSALVRWSAVRWCVGALVGTNCSMPTAHPHKKKGVEKRTALKFQRFHCATVRRGKIPVEHPGYQRTRHYSMYTSPNHTPFLLP